MKLKRKSWNLLVILSLAILGGLLFMVFRPTDTTLTKSITKRPSNAKIKVKSNTKIRPKNNIKNNIKITDADRSVQSPPKDSGENLFKLFKLSSRELELFYSRRYEPRDVNIYISGLEIDRRAFNVETAEELPKKLNIPLPGKKKVKEFNLQRVDFNNRNNFVWVGKSIDNKLEETHISYYRGAIVGSLQTMEGSYEIKQLSPNKNIIRQIDNSKFPELIDDVVVDEI